MSRLQVTGFRGHDAWAAGTLGGGPAPPRLLEQPAGSLARGVGGPGDGDEVADDEVATTRWPPARRPPERVRRRPRPAPPWRDGTAEKAAGDPYRPAHLNNYPRWMDSEWAGQGGSGRGG